MNRRAAASVDAIRRALPLEPPGELLLLMVFGSQVRNTETPDSDLDILYVSRTGSGRLRESLNGALSGARGGVPEATVFAYTPQTLEKYANLYGMPEYHALRGHGSAILYRSPDACRVLDPLTAAGVGGCPDDGRHRPDVQDFALWARRWLDRARHFLPPAPRAAGGGLGSASACHMACVSIDCAVKACLLHHRIPFPFTRDIRALCHMLPAACRPPLDPAALSHWSRTCDKRGAARGADAAPPPPHYTASDAHAAVWAAWQTHGFASELLPPDPPPGANDRIGPEPHPVPDVFRTPDQWPYGTGPLHAVSAAARRPSGRH